MAAAAARARARQYTAELTAVTLSTALSIEVKLSSVEAMSATEPTVRSAVRQSGKVDGAMGSRQLSEANELSRVGSESQQGVRDDMAIAWL